MDKKMKITITVCVLVVIATAAILWWYNGKEKKADTVAKPDGANTTPGSGTPTGTVSVFPLHRGSKCKEVGALQAKMNGWMNYNYISLPVKPSKQQLTTDNDFGAKTLEFVRMIFKADEVSQANYNWLMKENYTSAEKPIWNLF